MLVCVCAYVLLIMRDSFLCLLLFLHLFIYFHFLVIFHFLLKHVRLYRLYFIIPMQLAQAGSIFVFGRFLSVYEENINRFYAVQT